MEEYDVPSAASILASVKEQEARFERLTRALEEERRNVSLQLDRGSLPSDRLVGGTTCGSNQPLAWQQMVMQVNHSSLASHASVYVNEQSSPIPRLMLMLHHFHYFHEISLCISFSLSCVRLYWAIVLGCCSAVTHHLCSGSVVFTLFYLPISLHHVLFQSISQTIPFALGPLWESNVYMRQSYEDAFLGWITKVNMRGNQINTIAVLQYLHSAKLFTRVVAVGS